jgi:hypothetical protein
MVPSSNFQERQKHNTDKMLSVEFDMICKGRNVNYMTGSFPVGPYSANLREEEEEDEEEAMVNGLYAICSVEVKQQAERGVAGNAGGDGTRCSGNEGRANVGETYRNIYFTNNDP